MGETEFKDASREVQRQYEEAKKRVEDNCRHVKGGLGIGYWDSNIQSIAWHLYEDGVLRGVCTECLKVFEPGDPLYVEATAALHARGYSNNARVRVDNQVSTCGTEAPVIETKEEIALERAKQFVDCDWAPFPEEGLKEFIKKELLAKFVEDLFQEYLKVLKS